MKTFKKFIKESRGWTLNDFKTVIASSRELEAGESKAGDALRDRYLPQLVALLNQYATGDVPSPIWNNSIKYVVNHVAEIGTKYPARIYAVIRGNHSINSWDYSVSYINNVPGKLKRVQAELKKKDVQYGMSDNLEFLKWLESVLVELAPVAAAIEDMKGRVVKRQPKPVEDPHEKYVAPMASKASGKLVINALTEMTRQIYDDFAKAVTTFFISELERLNKLDYEEQRNSRSELFSLRVWKDRDSYKREPQRLKSSYKDVAAKEGKQAADDMQQQFVYKNAKKLASLIDAKKSGLKNAPEILSAKAGVRGTFEGDMRISFADGSSFEVRNQVVFKTNQFGTFFMQYPTTFHNVIFPDGSKMGQPSEERMNTVFTEA